MTAGRRGFTLVELLMVVTLGSLILVTVLQVLVTNQRTYTAMNAEVQGTQAIRGALAVLSNELREISPAGGDLVIMTSDSLQVRAMRSFGIVCHDTVIGVADWRVIRVGDWIGASDSVFIFADNDSETSQDDAWILTTVTSRDTMSTCGGGTNAQLLSFASPAPFAADSVSSGAEVRAFTHVWYGLMQTGGESYLGRRLAGGSWTPIVGPLRSDGISFGYFDDAGSVTSTATDVTQIQVTVRTGSEVLSSTGQLVTDSLSVRIHTRN